MSEKFGKFHIQYVVASKLKFWIFILAKEVDTHKMMAIGVKNLLKTISKQRQTEQRDLQVN